MMWFVRRLAIGLASLVGLAVLVVGFPVGIVVAFGSPVPSSMPSVNGVWTTLTQSGLTNDEIRTIAGWACWLLWLVPAWTVLAEAVALVRTRNARRVRVAGPLQPLIAQLVAWCALSFAPAPPRHAGGVPAHRQALVAVLSRADVAPVQSPPAGAAPAAETVEIVRSGDSAWRIAGRRWGNPFRWVAIWQMDRGIREPDGRRWEDPDVMYPGWRLPLPADAASAPPPAPGVGSPSHATGQRSAASERTAPPAPSPTAMTDGGALSPPDRPGRNTVRPPSPPMPTPPLVVPRHPTPCSPRVPTPRGGVLDLPSGGAVAAWFVAGVGTAVALGRLHRRRQYRPGDPRPALGARPSERLGRLTGQLRQEHLGGWGEDEAEVDTRPGDPTPPPVSLETGLLTLGEADGHAVAVDVLAQRGIGVIGPGAEDMVRALVIDVALRRHERVGLLLTTAVEAALDLDGLEAHPAVRVMATLDAALGALEVEAIGRAGLLERCPEPDMRALLAADPGEPTPVLLVVAEVPESEARLHAILAAGPRLAIGALLLGEWRSGVTIEVGDGRVVHRVADCGDGRLQTLQRGHVVALPARDARECVDAVRQSYGEGAAAASVEDVGSRAETEQAAEASTDTGLLVVGGGGQPAVGSAEPDRPVATIGGVVDEPSAALPADTVPPIPEHIDDAPRPVRVSLLGGFRIDTGDGDEIKTGLRAKARELLAFLLLHPHGVTLDRVVDTLWQRVDADRATNQLYTVLGNLRSVLRAATGLTTVSFVDRIGEQYRVDPALIDTDVWRFEAALLRANASASDRETVGRALEGAAALFAGDPLDGMSYGWAEPLREDIRARAVTALTRLADLHEETEPERAAEALEQAVRIDPYSEGLYQRLIPLLGRLGRRDAVRRTWRQVSNRLDEIDVDPDEETDALVRAALAASPREARLTGAPAQPSPSHPKPPL